MARLRQECPLIFVWLSVLLYVALLAYFLVRGDILWAAAWLVGAPLLQWLYIRTFPSTSRFMGYGRVDDRAPKREAAPPAAASAVTMYTSALCPFCPIVKRRLRSLRERMAFELEVVDVTTKPDIVKEKGIRALPVVEVDGRIHVGNATTEQLAALIQGD